MSIDPVEAFDMALDAAEATRGTREKVTFRGADIDALVESAPIDLQPGPGGYVEGSLVSVSVHLSVVELPLEETEAITVRGRDLEVITSEPLAGRLRLICGDPMADVD